MPISRLLSPPNRDFMATCTQLTHLRLVRRSPSIRTRNRASRLLSVLRHTLALTHTPTCTDSPTTLARLTVLRCPPLVVSLPPFRRSKTPMIPSQVRHLLSPVGTDRQASIKLLRCRCRLHLDRLSRLTVFLASSLQCRLRSNGSLAIKMSTRSRRTGGRTTMLVRLNSR